MPRYVKTKLAPTHKRKLVYSFSDLHKYMSSIHASINCLNPFMIPMC